MKYILIIALIFATQALMADDQCQKDITYLHEEVEKMLEDVKAQNANATGAVLHALIATVPALEKACKLEGACEHDLQEVEGFAQKMQAALEAGNWTLVDENCRGLLHEYEQAHTDCQAPGPTPDQCRQDLFNLEIDYHKLGGAVKAHQAEATEAELKYMVTEIPRFEQACNLTGNCASDWTHAKYVAEYMLNQTMHGNWNGTEEGFKRLTEVLEHTRLDCGNHPSPPHPSECKEAEERMEDVLEGCDASVRDRFQDGVEKFSQQLEHEVYNIERACSVLPKCRADWERVGQTSKVVYDEAEKADWDQVVVAWNQIYSIVQDDIYDDCDHHHHRNTANVYSK